MPDKYIKPGDHFNVVVYTGNGSGSTQTINVGFKPDLVWIKVMNENYSPVLVDSIRGSAKNIRPSSNEAEMSNGVNAFTDTGFIVGNGNGVGNAVETNDAGKQYVAWCWKANGTGVVNNAGSIASTVSANKEAGFSIVKWDYNNSGGTIGHGLDKAPTLILQKDLVNSNWDVYHVSVGSTKRTILNDTQSPQTYQGPWNNTDPTDKVFSSGGSWYTAGNGIISYCFHDVPGYSKFGSYVGNGYNDGAFIYTGFKPKFVMIKVIDASGGWRMYDSARSPFNVITSSLKANGNDGTQDISGVYLDFLSNGFKCRGGDQDINNQNNHYIYMAFAENPFKYANAR